MFKLFTLLLFTTLYVNSQTKFTNSKSGYSFVFPEGWYKKEKFTTQMWKQNYRQQRQFFCCNCNAKSNSEFKTASQMMKGLTNQELKEQFDGLHGETTILKRGVVYLDGVEFYYIFHVHPILKVGRLKLLNKQYAIYKNKIISIDACAIETFIDETTPVFALMLNTFRFN